MVTVNVKIGYHRKKSTFFGPVKVSSVPSSTGDNVGYYEFDQRFEHPGRTWASATHCAFSFACVGAAMANETWKFVQTKSKHAMKQVLGIKNEAARMKVTPPLAVAPHVHGDDMRWNPNDDGISFNP